MFEKILKHFRLIVHQLPCKFTVHVVLFPRSKTTTVLRDAISILWITQNKQKFINPKITTTYHT